MATDRHFRPRLSRGAMNEAYRPMKLRHDDYIKTRRTRPRPRSSSARTRWLRPSPRTPASLPGHPWHVRVDLWTMHRGENDRVACRSAFRSSCQRKILQHPARLSARPAVVHTARKRGRRPHSRTLPPASWRMLVRSSARRAPAAPPYLQGCGPAMIPNLMNAVGLDTSDDYTQGISAGPQSSGVAA